MLGLAFLRVQATLPQRIPRHFDNLLLCAKKAVELAVFHSNSSKVSGRPVHDDPGVK
jgi:hypothetical protein